MATSRAANRVDIAVIGAGISGLCFARTYLAIHPEANLLLFEKENGVGGVWSRQRVYDDFWTQGAAGYLEFSDLPMPTPPPQDMLHGFFRAEHTTSYLDSYAAHHDFNGRSLLDRVAFNTAVDDAERGSDGTWVLRASDRLSNATYAVHAVKLVVASGTTSNPAIPHLRGMRGFNKPIVHNFAFGSSTLLQDQSVRKVAVLGAGKSSADMVYALLKAGKDVSWIVRPGGTGPLTLVPPEGAGPYKSAFDIGSTRLAGTLQPSVLNPRNLWTWFLHESWLGRKLLAKVWTGVEAKIREMADHHGRPSVRGFEKLEPHTPMFWQNNPAGLLNHSDFFDEVARAVTVHSDDVSSLGAGHINLASGSTIETDALVLGTGWTHSLHYLDAHTRAMLGLPHPDPNAASKEWSSLERDADAAILDRFPMLAHPPLHVCPHVHDEPFRLYKLIAPVDDAACSIACIGQVSTANYFSTTEAQSLWATAYFDGALALPPAEVQRADVARFVTWNRRRYLATGAAGANVSLESVAYVDGLLGQLGLKSHCASWSWWAFWFRPCRAVDLKGLIGEYRARYLGGS